MTMEVSYEVMTMEVSYEVMGTQRRYSQHIPQELMELGEVHFVVGARGNCDIRLLV